VFNYSNLFGPHAVTEHDINIYRKEVQNILACAAQVRETGILEGHLSKSGEAELVLFPQLPYVKKGNINSPSSIERLQTLGKHAQEDIDLVINFGIGGSYLGNKVLFDVQCGEFWNSKTEEERNHFPKVFFAGNNVDARHITELIEYVKRDAKTRKGYKVLLLLISKSGSTIEPMANFMVILDMLKQAQIAYEVVAVTDVSSGKNETLLHRLAKTEEWTIFSVPDGVGGRFSVFSEVGLTLAAVIGFDIKQFLAGAADMDRACQETDVWKNPALLNALLKFIASEKYHRHIEIFMPYGGYMRSIAEWYVQLLAESLGKKIESGSGEYGRTPVAAIGTMDMHAQTQEHQEGRRNKVIQFLRIMEWKYRVHVPDVYSEFPKLEVLGGLSFRDIMNAALDSNAEALRRDGRFNAEYTLPKLNAYYVGQLLFMLCWSIFFEGQLAGVDAFNQPGVEVYKSILGPKLEKLKEK